MSGGGVSFWCLLSVVKWLIIVVYYCIYCVFNNWIFIIFSYRSIFFFFVGPFFKRNNWFWNAFGDWVGKWMTIIFFIICICIFRNISPKIFWKIFNCIYNILQKVYYFFWEILLFSSSLNNRGIKVNLFGVFLIDFVLINLSQFPSIL